VKASTADRGSDGPARKRILAACRVVGWILVVLLVLAAVEGLRVLRDEAATRGLTGDRNRRDFVQRVIACRHPKGLPTRSWHECELEVQNDL
jgi:hypothetical protein